MYSHSLPSLGPVASPRVALTFKLATAAANVAISICSYGCQRNYRKKWIFPVEIIGNNFYNSWNPIYRVKHPKLRAPPFFIPDCLRIRWKQVFNIILCHHMFFYISCFPAKSNNFTDFPLLVGKTIKYKEISKFSRNGYRGILRAELIECPLFSTKLTDKLVSMFLFFAWTLERLYDRNGAQTK